jgi:hypothetical protein
MSLAAAAHRLRQSRDRARDWLLGQVAAGGRPAAAELGNGWSRLPWTLALLGETEAGAAVLDWAGREALDGLGGFSPGLTYGAARFPAYPIGHLATGAVLLERHDIASRLFAQLEALQHPATGGMRIESTGGTYADLTDLLSTAQAGMAALLGGRMALAQAVRGWIGDLYAEQPALPDVLFTFRSDTGLVTEPPQALAWSGKVDFTQPRQAYFFPGIAAAFLALYAMRTGEAEALVLGHRYLEVNLSGTSAQFDDLASVQACKFGWGVALMQVADPNCDYADKLVQMADWFVARQREDGSWGPSTFVSASPSHVELMTKTAEHAMEVTAVLAGLAVAQARSAAKVR